MFSVLGLIPARGGSKGIPRKNVRPLAGRPLISYTIEVARGAASLERVVVSTDEKEIARVARDCGAEVPFLRPDRCATDSASSMSVVLHALEWFRVHEQYEPDAVALLTPTTPLRTAAQIDGCVELLQKTGLGSAVTVIPVHDHPYFVYALENGGRLREILPQEPKPQRRQDLPSFYRQSQAVIVTRRRHFDCADEETPVLSVASAAGLVIDRESAWDIDTHLDWMVVEQLVLMRRKSLEAATPEGSGWC